MVLTGLWSRRSPYDVVLTVPPGPGLDQFGDTILFTTDDDILEAMSRFDETFPSEGGVQRAWPPRRSCRAPARRTARGRRDPSPRPASGRRT